MRYIEALTDNDQKDILNIERDILDAKEDLIGAEADDKESIKSRIENLRLDIDRIKQSAQESVERKNEVFVDGDLISTRSGSSYTELYKNPTRKELLGAFKEDYTAVNFGELRGVLMATGELFIVIIKEAELIHDEILKLLAKRGFLTYSSGWETESASNYLAVFIDNNFSITPSEESYGDVISLSILEGYQDDVSSNNYLSHMEFNYGV